MVAGIEDGIGDIVKKQMKQSLAVYHEISISLISTLYLRAGHNASPELPEALLPNLYGSKKNPDNEIVNLCMLFVIAATTVSLLYDLAGGSACRRGQHLLPANCVYSSKLKSH